MFFVFSKILAFLLAPMLHSLFCLLASGLFLLIKAKFLARLCLILAGALPLLYSWTFFGEQLVRPLENYADIPTREVLDRAAGVIVLGGYGGNGMISAERQEPQISGAGERFIKAVELARLYPKKQVWFSGFSSQLTPTGWSEAENTAYLLGQLGLPVSRFSFEARSRNTFQNAVFMFNELRPSAEQDWVLLTSASHMKRALASFKAAGWTSLVPYPVDFQTTSTPHWGRFSPGEGFSMVQTGLHEHVGYLAYWLSGRI